MARITIPIVFCGTTVLKTVLGQLIHDRDYEFNAYYSVLTEKLDEAIRRQTYLILDYRDISPNFVDDIMPRKLFTRLTLKYGRDTLERYLMIVPPEYIPVPGVSVDLMEIIRTAIDDAEYERRGTYVSRCSLFQRLKLVYRIVAGR
jgi:hypothetical protein